MDNKKRKREEPIPFWNGQCFSLSRTIPSPSASDSSSPTQSFSWFTVATAALQGASTFNLPPSAASGTVETGFKTRKIRLSPTKEQKQILNNWFHIARWTYNQCLNAIKTGTDRDMKTLREKCINNGLFKDTPWVLKTPYDIRDEAMRDLLKAYNTNFAAKRQQFDMKFKSKKAPSDSITILSKHYKSKGVFFPRFWGKEPIKAREELPEKLEYDSRIVRTRLGHFYFCIPTPIVVNSDATKNNIIALDPGIRTFCTGYDPSGRALELGKGDIGRIHRLCYAYDKLQSKWSQADVRHAKRYRYKKAGLRIHRCIRNLVDDMHKKLRQEQGGNHLCHTGL